MLPFNLLALVCLAVLMFLSEVLGHGMLLDPPGRSSRWRSDRTAPVNYDDNGLNCGGFSTQWSRNGGKCGLCGDNYGLPTPRPNEIGGTYGQGTITKTYAFTRLVNLGIRITANHLGFFYFEICNLDVYGTESEPCFNKYRLRLADGSDKKYVGSATGWVNATIVLPQGLSCNHCVLRWNYQSGNNWGFCGDGSGGLGCGPQENFKNCADIRIYQARSRSVQVFNEIQTQGSVLKAAADVPEDAPPENKIPQS